jgi:hypothetical protein
VDFDFKLSDNTKGKTAFKEHILKLIPHSIKKLYYSMDDELFYREITQELQNADKNVQFKHPIRPNAYNSYIVQWYLFSVKNKINNRNLKL